MNSSCDKKLSPSLSTLLNLSSGLGFGGWSGFFGAWAQAVPAVRTEATTATNNHLQSLIQFLLR
jgi:hypothetical protein